MSRPLRSALAKQITAYVALKRALGRRFDAEAYVLSYLDRFLVAQRPRPTALTPDLFAAWSFTFAHLMPTVRRSRMRTVRNFCLYLRRTDSHCFVPDVSGFPAPHIAQRPHIFSEDQIVQLLHVASRLPPRSTSPLRAEVFRIAVVLLYTCGLRREELVRLVMSDYDASNRTLLVRSSKFHKSRLVALSKSAIVEMERYLRARRRFPHHDDAPLLANLFGGLGAYSGGSFGFAMRSLFRAADVRRRKGAFRESMIFATPTRSTPCCAGIGPASTFKPSSQPLPPQWATSTSRRRRTTSVSSSPLRRQRALGSSVTAAKSLAGSRWLYESGADCARPRVARLLRRSSAQGPRCESTHGVQLP